MHRTSLVPEHDRADVTAEIPQLDGLRGLAALGILVFHVWALAGAPQAHLFGVALTPVAACLFLAVDLFFILSGFLLTRAWFAAELTGGPRPSAVAYWKRRALRILPAYYVCLALVGAVGYLARAYNPDQLTGSIGAWNVLAHALVLAHFVPVAAGDFGGLTGAHWTLSLEVTFYAVLPVLAVALGGRRWIAAIPVAIAIAVGWTWLAMHSLAPLVHALMRSVAGPVGVMVGFPPQEFAMRSYLAMWSPSYLPAFVVGMVVARLYVAARLQPPGVATTWWTRRRTAAVIFGLGAALTLGLVYTLYGIPNANPLVHYTKHIPAALTLGLVMYGLTLGPTWLARPFASRIGRGLGAISYSVFLYHVAVILLLLSKTPVGTLPPVPRFWALLAATCIIVLPLSVTSYWLVERPFLRRRRRTRTAKPERDVAP